jgi:uncharacterized protein
MTCPASEAPRPCRCDELAPAWRRCIRVVTWNQQKGRSLLAAAFFDLRKEPLRRFLNCRWPRPAPVRRLCFLENLLKLQELDLRIERCKGRELEIPRQKEKFLVQKQRLAAELEEREESVKQLQVAQRECESEIDQWQAQIGKYDTQLLAIKKNEEYQALLHEMDGLKKQIAQKEERILALMMEIDDSKARLEEDRKRIGDALAGIERQCGEIDAELAEAVAFRDDLEQRRIPAVAQVDPELLPRYDRIRFSKKFGPAAVPLKGEVCTGCNMMVTAQEFNEVLAGKVLSCKHCGRLLYHKDNVSEGAPAE